MAETLTELKAKITTDASGLKSGLSSAEKQTEESSKRMSDSLKQVGVAMAASGAAITAALGMMGKAAIDEEINVKRLATTIENSGTAYDSVKDSLEAVIATTQRKTGIADTEQRNILNRLLLVTNDYNKALELMPTVLDLAAAGEMDATTAATYLGKAYLELEDGAEEVSVRFGQASLQFKNMEDIQNRVAGSAENLKNPLSALKATVGDVGEAIGATLTPMIEDAVDKIYDITLKIQDWVKENPELAANLTKIALALGVFLGVVGTALLLIPKLKAAWVTLQFVFTASPWGAIIAGIALLIAAGIALYKNWDTVTHFFEDAWSNIKQFFLEGVDFVLSTLEKFVGFIPGLKDKIADAREAIGGMIEAEKIDRDARDAERALREVEEALEETTEVSEEMTDATEEQTEAVRDNVDALEEQKAALEETRDKLQRMREEYEYARSDAGRLNITVEDVTFALFDMGLTTAEVEDKFIELGDDADNVNKVLEAFGLTAQEINDILEAQKTKVDNLNNSYSAMSKSASTYSGPTFAKDIEYQNGTPVLTYEQTLAYQHGQLDIPGFATGGVVPGTIGTPVLATVHGGETIIPANESMGGITVNFTQPVFFDREDDMNRFVDKISKTLDRKYRLSGRL
jgi:hypothetical protein